MCKWSLGHEFCFVRCFRNASWHDYHDAWQGMSICNYLLLLKWETGEPFQSAEVWTIVAKQQYWRYLCAGERDEKWRGEQLYYKEILLEGKVQHRFCPMKTIFITNSVSLFSSFQSIWVMLWEKVLDAWWPNAVKPLWASSVIITI